MGKEWESYKEVFRVYDEVGIVKAEFPLKVVIGLSQFIISTTSEANNKTKRA